MAGYTPVFDTVLDGTLFGKWPHTGVWLCLLSQCDRRGQIDVVPALLAAKIGVPLETLLECIDDFMQPDPGSRTGDLEGRRLELIHPESREWGWKVINHGIYREKARKSVYDKERTESGKDAERKRSREVPRSPAKSRPVPLSEAEANSKKGTTVSEGKPRPKTAKRCPAEFQPDLAFANSEVPDLDAVREAAKFKDWEFKTPRSDWPACWRTWIRNARERGTYAKKPTDEIRWSRTV